MNTRTTTGLQRTVARLCASMIVLAVLAMSGCASRPTAKFERPVWPPPPETARIQFVRSLFSEEDLGKDTTFNEKVLELLAGAKPPADRIAEPLGIAVSDDGNRLYISDYVQLAVFVFDFPNKKFKKIGADTPLARPLGIALDKDENIYVAEQEKKLVSVFDRNGNKLRVITDPSLEKPGGIGIDRVRGRLYVADTAHTKSTEHTVKIFDLQGKLLGKLGHDKGSEDGQFLFPTYTMVDKDGNVYVTDTLNSRVQKFDPDGKFVRRYGERGNGWGMFDKPKGAALDSFGNLYVVDSGWSNVQIFNQTGQILLFFGGRGSYPGQLQNPAAIAIDGKNRIYVGDYLNHRVEVYQLVNTAAADSIAMPSAPPRGPGEEPTPPAKN